MNDSATACPAHVNTRRQGQAPAPQEPLMQRAEEAGRRLARLNSRLRVHAGGRPRQIGLAEEVVERCIEQLGGQSDVLAGGSRR